MSIKLKVLSLSMVAALAFSAVAVLNASANGGGHFVTSGSGSAVIGGHVNSAKVSSEHNLHLTQHNLPGIIGCDEQSYTATTTAETSTSLTVTPSYAKCYTTPSGSPGSVSVHPNGCTFTFTVAANTTDNTEQTAHLVCPAGKRMEITHAGCTVGILPQTVTTGLTYTTKMNGQQHEVTMDVNIQFSTTRHGGACIFVPTHGNGTLSGSVTVTAKRHDGTAANITAT